ncbi:MAG: hypothetical protein ACF8AM_14290 [Rhodopirellula sp. JB055]|uniref:hypothetical protein n=1 Tax=Rhodopirellula sp. JB055 TaxID=3342846 RepID=UPI00370A49F6
MTDAVYLPSPEEIAAKCREIRSTWDENERIRRMDCNVKLLDDCDFEQVHRAALAKLETRLTKHEGRVVIEETSRRGDPVPLEFEPLPLECF